MHKKSEGISAKSEKSGFVKNVFFFSTENSMENRIFFYSSTVESLHLVITGHSGIKEPNIIVIHYFIRYKKPLFKISTKKNVQN